LSAGCRSNSRERIWENVKLGDLAPARGRNRPVQQGLKTVNVVIYTFEIPADNSDALNAIWPLLYTEPIRFRDAQAFEANAFVLGFGQMRMWDAIADLLRTAGGRKVESSTLLFSGSRANDLVVAVFSRRQEIFYVPAGGSTQSLSAGPGKVVLRLTAEKIPDQRGVCKFRAVPVYSPPRLRPIPQLANREKSYEFVFESLGFEVTLSPGEFVLLGPEKYVRRGGTLQSLFFSTGRPMPRVRTYLFVCTAVND